MANEDTHADSLPELTSGSVPPGAETVRNDAETPADTPADTIVPAVVDPIPVSIPLAEPNPIAPLRSSLVPLGSQVTPPAPQPKRFSAVNINKKFLEKNSASSSTSAPASANSQASKASSAVVRPPSQTTTTHSRLVTTKLTIAPQSLSAPGPGWSRPSSATPPATTATTNGPAPTPPGSGDPLPSNSGPQHSHGASAMQNQSRPVPVRGPGSRESAAGGVGKPVWGNASKSHPQQRLDMTSQNDFPTAAEVAAAPRKTKPSLADRNMAKEPTAQELASAAANKLARMEQADTFRGVHLDPNAHHWDEMDADDDNFLDGVIEFGDGRQYKIESSDPPADNAPAAAAESSSSVPSRSGSRLDRDETQQLNVPVSKEERFADDFDRSWPRSRASPSVSTRDLPGGPALSTNSSNAAPSPVSPAISMTSDSASRALLFNERSNKLEPYNRGAAGAGVRRGSGGNEGGFPSPTDLRSGARDQFNRGRGFNSASGSAFGSERGQPQQQRRDGMPGPPLNAPQQSPRAPPPNPWTQRKDSNEVETRGRRTVMGPPPVPPPGGSGGRQRPPHLPLESEGGFPVRPNRRPSTSRESRVPPSAPAPAVEPSSARRAPSQSPALSHASAVAQSPVVPVPVVPPQVDLDEVRKDVMQSAAARAKARRQQEEEEREKEKERARRKAAEIEGRMKAAEAEKAAKAKRAAEEAAHAQDVLDIIESAVKSVQPDVATTTKPAAATDIPAHEQPKPPLRRPSLVGPPLHSQPPVDSRSGGPRRTSSSAPVPPPLQTSPASWRSKPSPASTTMPVTSTPVLQQPQQVLPRPSIPPIPTLVAPPSALEQVESLAENAEEREELEVVNFSDLGKFIGVTEEEAPTRDPEPEVKQRETPNAAAPAVRAPRPSAADFFDDRPPRSPEVEKTNIASWRRPNVQDPGPSLHAQPTGTGKDRLRGEASEASNAVSTAPAKDTSLSVPSTSAAAAPTPHAPSPHVNRTPRTQPFYKEATMSTLDDVMSRIKGAIDGMSSEKEHRSPEVSAVSAVTRSSSSMFHTTPTANLSLQRERWVPPAFRIRHQFDAEPQEVITTGCEPPRSPKAWKTFLVRLPKVSTQLEPVKPKQLALCTRQAQFRWDVLSFDPPVEGMSRKELTVNEILFRRTAFKGKSKYKVLLPNSRTAGPKVNIPISPRVSGVGAFGRPPAPADALSTWRKQPLVSTSKNVDLGESETGLSTMSRSPPPELPSDPNVASIPRTDLLTSSKSEDVFGSSRSRSQPKMPAGSAVAFYRDSRVDAVEPDTKPLVNFIVNSELEDSSKQSSDNTQSKKPSITVSSPSASSSLAQGEPLNIASKPFTPRANGLRLSPTSSPEIGMPSLMSNSKTESKSSDDSTDRTPITPPSHHTASWARSSFSLKDSPLRGPDPEHLKAVWSQTSNKAGLHAVNSLEGIADDLTAIPFTLQDVKSEDGGTPPPTTSTTSIASSRMSLHDVTRAFQQVPSSSSSSLRPPISPPSTTAPVARPNPAPTPAYSYTLPPPPAQMMRPTYTAYSPLMSSPSTPMMYPMAPSPAPVPARMGINGMAVNGHSPLYGQPVWMAPPPPQNPMNGSMIRPLGSPYPQMMPYPSPGGSPMYAPQQPQPIQTPQPQPNGPRGRSMSSVMSPVMPHQNVMFQASPILMHTPPIPVGYMNMPPGGRGQTTGNHNGHPPMQPQQQHQPQQSPHQPNGHSMQHTPGYNPVPSTSFMRPQW